MNELELFLNNKNEKTLVLNEFISVNRIFLSGSMIFDCSNKDISFSSRNKRVVKSWIEYQLKKESECQEYKMKL